MISRTWAEGQPRDLEASVRRTIIVSHVLLRLLRICLGLPRPGVLGMTGESVDENYTSRCQPWSINGCGTASTAQEPQNAEKDILDRRIWSIIKHGETLLVDRDLLCHDGSWKRSAGRPPWPTPCVCSTADRAHLRAVDASNRAKRYSTTMVAKR